MKPGHAAALAIILLAPAGILFFASLLLFFKARTAFSFLQLIGAGCLVLVVLFHLCEALSLFPWMGWGRERSFGHYLDWWSAVLGLTLFPVGYLLEVLFEQHV
jgi:succinate dehydrogenase/fumarate reductase cytochrome b subunit